jgi:hypothetical protein
MNAVRWAAVAATALMSLMNVPVAVDRGEVPVGAAWAATVLGVVGLVAAVGLSRRQPWGRPAVLAVGALNLAGAIVAVVNDWDGAAIGLTVSVVLLVLAFLTPAQDARRTPAYGG